MIRFFALNLFFLSVWLLPFALSAQINMSGTASEGGAYDHGSLFMLGEQGGATLLHSFYEGPQYPAINNGFTTGPDGQLYTLMQDGGRGNNGTLARFNTAEDSLEVIYGLLENSNAISAPVEYLIPAGDSAYFGVSNSGGENSRGAIFSYDISTESITILYNFRQDNDNGAYPNAAPLIVNDTMLYGTTQFGGSFNQGIFYRYDLANNTFYKLADFNASTIGSQPRGQLTLAADGHLYGVASFGGTNNSGTIFRHNITSATTEKVAHFNTETTGEGPVSGLVEINGQLTGVCEEGGAHEKGTLFSFDPDEEELNLIADFGASDAPAHPRAAISKGAGSTFYFVSTKGGAYNEGVLAKYDISSGNLTSLHSFGNNEDGKHPQSKLHISDDGLIYGMTTRGGSYNRGVIFQYDTTDNTYETKLSLEGNYFGSRPSNRLIYDTVQQKIYGAARGGSNNEGILFEADPFTGEYAIAHHFSLTTDGTSPQGRIIKGPDHHLYGVCTSGGEHEAGTLWKFSPENNTLDVLHHFTESEGKQHEAGLTFNADSTFMAGIARRGGENDDGSLYTYSLEDNSFVVMHSFNSQEEGRGNESHLFLADNGVFYGMTWFGGANNRGAIYAFATEDSSFSTVYNFESNSGYSRNSFTRGSGSTLYTMVQHNNGQLIAFDYQEETINVLWESGNNRPRNPLGNVFLAPDEETLIGTFREGPGNNNGQAFAYYLPRNNYRVIKNFTGEYGANIRGSLISWGDCLLPELTTPFRTRHDADTLQLCSAEGDTLLSNEITGVTNYLWFRKNNFLGFQDTSQYTVNTENNFNGGYSIKGNNACGNVYDTIGVHIVRLDTSTNLIEDQLIAGENRNKVSYQWYNCEEDFLVSDADERTFEPEENGTYAVALTHDYGCADSSFCKTFSINGLQELSMRGDINVYPTQFHESLTISLPDGIQNVKASLRNTSGQEVQDFKLSQGDNHIITGAVKPGMYVILLEADGEQVGYKVIKK